MGPRAVSEAVKLWEGAWWRAEEAEEAERRRDGESGQQSGRDCGVQEVCRGQRRAGCGVAAEKKQRLHVAWEVDAIGPCGGGRRGWGGTCRWGGRG